MKNKHKIIFRNSITETGFSKLMQKINKLKKILEIQINLMMNLIQNFYFNEKKMKPMSLLAFSLNVSRLKQLYYYKFKLYLNRNVSFNNYANQFFSFMNCCENLVEFELDCMNQ